MMISSSLVVRISFPISISDHQFITLIVKREEKGVDESGMKIHTQLPGTSNPRLILIHIIIIIVILSLIVRTSVTSQ